MNNENELDKDIMRMATNWSAACIKVISEDRFRGADIEKLLESKFEVDPFDVVAVFAAIKSAIGPSKGL